MNIKEIIDKERPAPFCGDSLSATDIELMLDRIESAVNKEIADDNLALMQQIKLWSTACKEAEERIAELEAQVASAYKQGYDDGHSKGFTDGYTEKEQELK